jgi:hypothetical protein
VAELAFPNPDKAVAIVLDVEQLVFEVNAFFERSEPDEPLLGLITPFHPSLRSQPACADGLRGPVRLRRTRNARLRYSNY